MNKLNLIGTQTIETEHFILRKFKESDGEFMYKNWASSSAVAKYVTWNAHQSEADSKSLCKLWEEDSKSVEIFNWAMELKETHEPIGNIAVVDLNQKINQAAIGYCMGENWWNKGYMTECFKAVIDFLFGKVTVNRISACHHTSNPASGKVMKKCGLKFEGIKRQGALHKSELCDLAEYAILKEDWNALKRLV